ncbi:FAD-binding oxidoreductase [Streptoalloteichus hindustanus]|nr:FAD-binding oxidoreductase [Streptoalloteichus hindustanus]
MDHAHTPETAQPDAALTGAVLADVAALRGRVRGPVFLPDEDGYADDCAGFQTAYQQRPSIVVGAVDAADVRAAVEFARAHGLSVAVQATGHGLADSTEGGLLISTRRMAGVRVDPATRTALVDAGTRWAQVIEAAAPHGLAPLSGSSPTVGAVSYVLGGGVGLLARRYGHAADHVRRIDVVTADGQLRQVTAERDADLFWALRGGQGNFGVVTGMEIDLVPVARLYGGGLVFDTPLIPEVLRTWLEWTTTLPDALTSSVGLIPFPDVPDVPEPMRGRFVAQVSVAYAGDAAEGERLVAPLRAIGPRLADTLTDMPYSDSAAVHNDPTHPHAYHSTNVLLRDLDASAVPAILAVAAPDSPAPCVVQLRHLGGALGRPPAVPNAVSHREARYAVGALTFAVAPGAPIDQKAHQRLAESLGGAALGHAPNFLLGGNPTAEEIRAGFDAATYQRLAAVKATYDPRNMFRHNQNIPPAVR